MNRQGTQGKTRLNTKRGNHRTRHSWVREAETQGQQVNTIRQTRETNDRKANTGRRNREDTRRKTFQKVENENINTKP